MPPTSSSPPTTRANDETVKARCKWCDQPFTLPLRGNGGRRPSYCSNAHKQAAYRARKSAAEAGDS